MKRVWLVLILILSCNSRDLHDTASVNDDRISKKSKLEKTIPEIDDESVQALTKGLSELSHPDQRVVEIDLSKRISQLDARQIYNFYAKKYGAGNGCLNYKKDIFFENDALSEALQSQEKINQAIAAGYTHERFKTNVSLDDIAPFLKEVKVWQNILAKSRSDLKIFPNRSCLFITTKEKEIPTAEVWHYDGIQGEITFLWTIYGRRTLYTLESAQLSDKKEILSPPYGSVLAFKNQGNTDKVKPIFHASPGKKHERLTFVTFFRVSK
jgi:hypothetical protein